MTELILKQRIVSLLDSFKIYDSHGDLKYIVKGKLSLSRHKLVVYDADGRELATLREKIIKLLPTFQIKIDGKTIGNIKKELTIFSPKFHVDFNKWKVKGNILEWDYAIYDGRREVARMSKKLMRLTDTYSIKIDREEDELYALLVVLAIDAVKCSKGKNGDDV